MDTGGLAVRGALVVIVDAAVIVAIAPVCVITAIDCAKGGF